MQYIIRPAKKEDISNVIDLAVETVDHSTSPFRDVDPQQVKNYRRKDLQSLYYTFESKNILILIAEDLKGNFLGHVITMVNYTESTTGEAQGYIFDLSVVKKYRGLGIGRNLMDNAEEFCQKAGMKYVCLNVTSSNRGAVEFYRNLNYSEERKRMIKVLKAPEKGKTGKKSKSESKEGQ